MRVILLFILFIGSTWHTQAADIKIRIVNSQGKGIPAANISLCRADTKTVLHNTVSDSSAQAIITGLPTGSYFLTAFYPGYQLAVTPAFSLPATDTLIILPTLVLRNNLKELTTVTVTAARPLIETADDRIIYNVNNDISLTGLSAAEALSKVPLVTVDGNGNVLLKGQSSYQIQLNGKQTSMFAANPGDVLKAFPASMISKIEVITNPSARYEGEGITGIINIITRKKVTGYNGTTAFNYNTIGQINPNASFNLRHGKWGVTSFLYYARNTGFDMHGSQQYTAATNKQAFAERRSLDSTHATGYMLGGNLEVAYEPDSLQTYSLYGRLAGSGKSNDQRSHFTTYDQHTQPLQYSLYETTENTDAPAGEWGIDYNRKFKQHQQQLSLSFNMQIAGQQSIINTNQFNTPEIDRFLNSSFKTNNLQHSFQADYTVPISTATTWEIGSRAISRKVRSTYNSEIKTAQQQPGTPDPANTDELTYRQNVIGAYMVLNHQWRNGYSAKVGARVERTTVNGQFISSKTTANQQYWSFLPSLSVSKELKDGKRITFAYNRRLARPGVTFLNPFRDTRDPLNIYYGNEQLQPENAHNLDASFTAAAGKISYSVSLNAILMGDAIQRVSVFDGATGVTTQTYSNVGKSRSVGGNAFLSLATIPKLNFTLNLNVTYTSLHNTANPQERNSGIHGALSTALTYTPATRVMIFSNATYTRAPIQLLGQNGDYLFYNIGGGYWLLNKKLMCSVAALNFMGKYWQMNSVWNTPGLRQQTTVNRPASAISFSLRYNFGKLKENTSRKKGVAIDDNKADIR